MGRTDNVFLLTLIDFLLQIIFFGVFMYALYIATSADPQAREQALRRLLTHFGISDIAILTDDLTRLIPPEAIKKGSDLFKLPKDKRQLEELRKLVEKNGDLSEIERKLDDAKRLGELNSFVHQNGELPRIKEKLEKLRKIEEGSGKPPCLADELNGKRIPRALGRVVASEEIISFDALTPDLKGVLDILGYSYSDVKVLSLDEFEKKFSPLRTKRPDCRYSMRFAETTRYVEPRDAVNRTFNFSGHIEKLYLKAQ